MLYFDKNTKWFYMTPDVDRCEITDEYHVELLQGQTDGKLIESDDSGYPILIDPAPTTIDELREFMTMTAVKARINLSKLGLLHRIIDLMNSLPDDTEIKIQWEYGTVFNRMDTALVDFCKQSLALTDEKIDELFLL